MTSASSSCGTWSSCSSTGTAEGTLTELPRKNIDTGAGFERILPVLQGHDSMFDTELFLPIIDAAASVIGTGYGSDERTDVSLRVLADHGRAMTMLVADGVLPANEGRGYVLRRVVRRAVMAARRLGVDKPIGPTLVQAATEVLGEAWPALVSQHDLIVNVVAREEAGFDRTLRAGLGRLEEAFATGAKVLPGDVAFTLHDTHGFPVELTEELARDAGVEVDRAGFDAAMREQRERARAAAKSTRAGDEAAYRSLLESEGQTDFVGRGLENYESPARVLAVLEGMEGDDAGSVEIFLDRTPFYAEGGGQIGDTGTIVTESGIADVYDTVYAVPGLIVHKARVDGELQVGQDALATIDGERREAIRRNHTATHLLHSALRAVLGDHVRQQGSLVSPDYLRFDFSHHSQPTPEELDEVFDLANAAVLTDIGVETVEATRDEAEKMGAIAFFGDKYGDSVRVVRAGPNSLEFCGGTHVDSLGQIGPITLALRGFDRFEHPAHLRHHREGGHRAGQGARAAGARRLGAVAQRARRTAGRHRPHASSASATASASSPSCASSRARPRPAPWPPTRPPTGASWWPGATTSRATTSRAWPRPCCATRASGPWCWPVLPTAPRWRSPPPPGASPTPPSWSRRWASWWAAGAADRPRLALAGGKDPSQIEAALAEAQRLLTA